jgi:hypothetical protein
MMWLVGILTSPFGRIGVGAALAVSTWLFVKFHYESKGAEKLRSAIIKVEKINVAKAAKARARVNKLQNRELRDSYFRD